MLDAVMPWAICPRSVLPVATTEIESSRLLALSSWDRSKAVTTVRQHCDRKGKFCSIVRHSAGAAGTPQNFGEERLREDSLLLDDDVKMLVKVRSRYNLIRVYEVARRADHALAGARLLLLDKPGNIHSVYYKYRVLTDSYYDLFGVLPALIPDGPVGILGLGAGTAARILQHFWPWIEIHGWEIDTAVINVARQFFDLSELEEGCGERQGQSCFAMWEAEEEEGIFCEDENGTDGRRGMQGKGKGRLFVHQGDALQPQATVEGGFAGLVVDLFAEGAVIPALQQRSTWLGLKQKLRPGGRIMVNCGGSCVEAEGAGSKNGAITMLETLAALASVFPGELHCKTLGDTTGDKSMDNCVAITGPFPDLQKWKQEVPESLGEGLRGWETVTEDDLLLLH